MTTMNIVEKGSDDITLAAAAALAGRSEKTLRRAVQNGQLLRRYVMTPRGPSLVFHRDELTGWIATLGAGGRGKGRHPRARALGADSAFALVLDRVSALQQQLQESNARLSGLAEQLQVHDRALGQAQETIVALAERLSEFDGWRSPIAQASGSRLGVHSAPQRSKAARTP